MQPVRHSFHCIVEGYITCYNVAKTREVGGRPYRYLAQSIESKSSPQSSHRYVHGGDSLLACSVALRVTRGADGRQALFFTKRDRQACCCLVADQLCRTYLPILAYQLINNHIHLVVMRE
jgi:hypothetical protein